MSENESELAINERVPAISDTDNSLLLKKSVSVSRAYLAPGQSMNTAEHKAFSAFLYELQSYQASIFRTVEEFHETLGSNTLVLRIPVSRWDILTASGSSRNSAHKKQTLQKLSRKQFIWEEVGLEGYRPGSDFENSNLFLSAGIIDGHVVFRIPVRTRHNLMVKASEPSFYLNIMAMKDGISNKYQYPLHELICQHIDLTSSEKQIVDITLDQEELLLRLKVEYDSKIVNGRVKPIFKIPEKMMTPARIKEKIITPAIEKLHKKRDLFGMDVSVTHKKLGDGLIIYTINVRYTPVHLKTNNSMLLKYKDEMVYIDSCFKKYPIDTKNRDRLETLAQSDERELLYIYDCWKRAEKSNANKISGYFLACYKQNQDHFEAITNELIERKNRELQKRRDAEIKSIQKQEKEELKKEYEIAKTSFFEKVQQDAELLNEAMAEFERQGHLRGLRLPTNPTFEDIKESPMARGIFRDFLFKTYSPLTHEDIEQRAKGIDIEGEVTKSDTLEASSYGEPLKGA